MRSLDTEKLLDFQVFLLLGLTSLAGVVFTAPSRAYWTLGYAGWQFITLGIIIEVLLIFMVNSLLERFPEETLVGVYRKVFGRFLGTALALPLVAWLVVTAVGVSWLIARGVKISLLTDTPIGAIFILGALTVLPAGMYGIVRLARLAEVLSLIIIPLLLGIMIIPWQNIDLGNLRPILIFPWEAYLNPSLWFSIFIFRMHAYLLVLRPRFINPPAAGKIALIALALVGGFFYATFAYPVAIFGMPVAKVLVWPFWASIRIVRFSGLPVEKLLYFAVVVWHFISLITSAFLLYGAAALLSELLAFSRDRLLILVLTVIYGILVFRIRNYTQFMHWDLFDIGLGWVSTVFIPAIALIVARLRGLGVTGERGGGEQ